MRSRNFALYSCLLLAPATANAFLEDICLPRRSGQDALTWCVRPECPEVFSANLANKSAEEIAELSHAALAQYDVLVS